MPPTSTLEFALVHGPSGVLVLVVVALLWFVKRMLDERDRKDADRISEKDAHALKVEQLMDRLVKLGEHVTEVVTLCTEQMRLTSEQREREERHRDAQGEPPYDVR
jgi:hypothetical protein